ncbi:MAG: hypothetical protein Tsb0020_42960 [Haliangiales bacterium]
MSATSRDQALHPSEGARFLFERASLAPDQSQAVYQAAIFTPDERFAYRVEMAIDGSFEAALCGPEAPAELAQKLATIAKLIARAAAGKQRDKLPPWPQRVLRWRGPGRG